MSTKALIALVLVCLSSQISYGRQLSEKEVIALTLLAEARGEGELGMRAVGSVIVNRARERRLSMRTVCLQPKQFSCWNGGGVPVRLLECREAAVAMTIANEMLDGRLDDVTDGSNHYCRYDCHPGWARAEHVTVKIRNHVFYRI